MALFLTNTYSYFVGYFITPISSIIVSRFILNLRQVSSYGETEDCIPLSVDSASGCDCLSQFDTSGLQYTSTFLGSIGAPLSHGSLTEDHRSPEVELSDYFTEESHEV